MANPPESSTVSRAFLPVLALVGCGAFLNVYTTQALLPELSREFAASSVVTSVTVSATTLAMALCAPLVGLLADATGRKRLMVGALLLLALPCLLIARTDSLGHLILWRFMQGLLIPGVMVVTTAYVAEELPAPRVPAALALYITGTVVGGFGGRFISGLVPQAYGWREAFHVIAVSNVLIALVAWVVLPRAKNFAPQSAVQALPTLTGHLRNPALLAACAVGFALLFALVAAFTYVNYHLAAAPYRLTFAALGAVFTVYLLGVIATPPSGRLVARLGYRRVLLGALALSALGFAATLAAPLPLIILGLAVGSSGIFIAQATTGYVAASVRSGRSLASGLYNLAYYAGGALGAVLVGLAYASSGWPAVVASVLATLALAAAIAAFAWTKRAEA
ncbi:MFS transporter [Deinococcus aluminii]|uniref:Inner membrane transport protein YnfM n=1 Tax=Deinococcus aluminii TaxID=1656885 RepID=A0ABP9XCD2_9DEIO